MDRMYSDVVVSPRIFDEICKSVEKAPDVEIVSVPWPGGPPAEIRIYKIEDAEKRRLEAAKICLIEGRAVMFEDERGHLLLMTMPKPSPLFPSRPIEFLAEVK